MANPQDLGRNLDDLNRNVRDLIEAFKNDMKVKKLQEEILKVSKRQNKALGENTKSMGDMIKHQGLGALTSRSRVNYELSRSGFQMELPLKRIDFALRSFIDIQKRLAGTQGSFSQLIGKNKNLGQGVGGFMPQAQAYTGLREGGFQGITTEMTNLTASMTLTGQESGRMVKALRDANILASVSEEGISRLSKDILGFSKTYGTQSDNLADAIGQLTEQMLDLGALDIGEDMTRVIAEAVSKYGKETQGPITAYVKEMLKMNTYLSDIRTGTQSIKNDSVNKPTLEGLERSWKEQGKFGEEQLTILRGNNQLTRFALERFTDLYGEDTKRAMQLSKLIPRPEILLKNQIEADSIVAAQREKLFSHQDEILSTGFGGMSDILNTHLPILEAALYSLTVASIANSVTNAITGRGIKGLMTGAGRIGAAAGATKGLGGAAAGIGGKLLKFGKLAGPVGLSVAAVAATSYGVNSILSAGRKDDEEKFDKILEKSRQSLNTSRSSTMQSNVNGISSNSVRGSLMNSMDIQSEILRATKENNQLQKEFNNLFKSMNSRISNPVPTGM